MLTSANADTPMQLGAKRPHWMPLGLRRILSELTVIRTIPHDWFRARYCAGNDGHCLANVLFALRVSRMFER
jgi:hypothetical protein